MFYILEGNCIGGIDKIIAIVKFLLKVVQYAVPVILIVLGTIDLVKAVIASKEEEIKNAQKMLIKRLIYSIIVFLVPYIVSVVMGWVGNENWKNCWTNTEPSATRLFDIDNDDGVKINK